MTTVAILNKITKPQVGNAVPANAPNRTFQLTVEGPAAVTITAFVEVSNDRKVWFPFCNPLTVSGNKLASDYWPPIPAAWGYVRATCTDITNGATGDLTMSFM